MQKPLTQQRAKRTLYIQTQFESQDEPANTVLMRDPIQQQWANDYIDGLSIDGPGIPTTNNNSIVDALNQQQPRILRNQSTLQLNRPSPNFQSLSIGLQTLNIFMKLWKRRMLIECFNSMRLLRRSGSMPRAPRVARHKHSSSVMQPPRRVLRDRSANRLGKSVDQDTSVERVRLLNQIADKLQRNSRRVIINQPLPIPIPTYHHQQSIQTTTSTSKSHQRFVQAKLDRLEHMLKDIKRINQASNKQSTVYSIRPNKEKRESRRERELTRQVHEQSVREEKQQQKIHSISRDIHELREEVRQMQTESRRKSQSPYQMFDRKPQSPSPQSTLVNGRTLYYPPQPQPQTTTYLTVTSPHQYHAPIQSPILLSKSTSGYLYEPRRIVETRVISPREFVYRVNSPMRSPVLRSGAAGGYNGHKCPMCGCGNCEEKRNQEEGKY